MRGITPFEYTLHLNTDEDLLISELDPGIVKELDDDNINKALSLVLNLCSYVTRLSVEEAKSGYSKKLTNQLRTEPVGALMKLDNPICKYIGDCSMAVKSECTTRNIKKGFGKFPECWEYQIKHKLSDELQMVATDLSRVIIHAWKEKKYVLIISG
jgi:hypothetical protein